ncbi:unnamed protein product, partial [Iphiclides podalirius]
MEENSGSGVPLSFHALAKSRRASSTSSASSSASSSAAHHHRKNRRRKCRNDKRMKRLEKAVDNLTATVSTIVKGQSIHSVPKMHENSDSDALSILVPDDSEASFSHDKTEGSQPVLHSFDFKQETTLKSTIPKTSTSHAETLCKLQHFDTIDWSQSTSYRAEKSILFEGAFPSSNSACDQLQRTVIARSKTPDNSVILSIDGESGEHPTMF